MARVNKPRITLSEHMGMTPKKQVKFMYILGLRIQARWRKLVRTVMTDVSANTRSIYRDAIEVVHYDENDVVVRMSNKFASMFEQGLGGSGVGSFGVFDMRKFLLNTTVKASGWPKMGPSGRWRPIPIKRTAGQLKAAVTKSLLAGGTKDLSKVGHAKKGLGFDSGSTKLPTRTVTRRDGSTYEVVREGVVPVLIKGPRTVFAMNRETGVRTTGQAQQHKTDIISGTMKRGGKNVTFRVISYGAKPWYHPGIRPRRLARKVINSMKTIMPDPRNPTEGSKA